MSDGHGRQPGPGVPPPPASGAAPPPPASARAGDAESDGVSLAAFITGLLSLGPVPLVLGLVGYERARRRGVRASWMAVTGIVLGAVSTIGLMITAALLAFSLVLVGHVAHVHDRYGTADGSWSWSRDLSRERGGGDARP
ncbi:DUF4190 domain-containing protein [Cellulomonas sp. ACRRI]|uniref:DUF4190 domain-containing protein n=1 Tax=Cellulomonas sp. ACRRI TaxID=2918188 RepID=UPI001EF3CBBF|nr:DUF4190 domain-containing protein [Cellulomonas sp. ACRRI]MCG7286470.1 DUF4190 domain-containing protein [Cellulomonas sp. ACRRI]